MQTPPRTALQDSRTSQPEHHSQTSDKLTLVVGALLAVFYLATSIYIASHRLFWFDEFFTVHGVKLASRRGADGERSKDRSGWDELRTRLRQLVGEGKWSASDIASALEAKDRTRCGTVAPPDGLYLIRVDY